jgi:cell fate (sporulation/competence/biofilm development) regulator YlbF (YheA/YmcA/DUF963 family)
MEATTSDSAVLTKTRELCQAILDQPNVRALRQRVDAFMSDEQAQALYDGLVAKSQALQHKQQLSIQPTSEEMADFEQHRAALFNNSVARGFLDAQEALHEVQQSVHHYVTKTLELGRLPTDEERNGGSCGQGCGCSH